MVSRFFGFFERCNFVCTGVCSLCILVGILCFLIFTHRYFVIVMLEVGRAHTHGGKGKNSDGEENASDQDGAHPDTVFDMGFSSAHSSPSSWPTTIAFGSAFRYLSTSDSDFSAWCP